jgi:hypothetical protein
MEASAAVIALVIGACVALIAAGLARRAAGSATRGALKKPPCPPGRHWLLRDLPSIIRYVKDEGLEPDEIMQVRARRRACVVWCARRRRRRHRCAATSPLRGAR